MTSSMVVSTSVFCGDDVADRMRIEQIGTIIRASLSSLALHRGLWLYLEVVSPGSS